MLNLIPLPLPALPSSNASSEFSSSRSSFSSPSGEFQFNNMSAAQQWGQQWRSPIESNDVQLALQRKPKPSTAKIPARPGKRRRKSSFSEKAVRARSTSTASDDEQHRGSFDSMMSFDRDNNGHSEQQLSQAPSQLGDSPMDKRELQRMRNRVSAQLHREKQKQIASDLKEDLDIAMKTNEALEW